MGCDRSRDLHTSLTQQGKVDLFKDLLNRFIMLKKMIRSVVSFWVIEAIFRYVHNEEM